MTEKPYVLVSLNEDKAKKLTQVLSNETSRKILDYLSKKEHATETEISKDLKIAMSTVHYNIKLLAESKLVTKDEYHYSEKGKEVIHYRIANKYIIIAPTEEEGFLEKIKSFLPAFIGASVIAGIIALTQRISSNAGKAMLQMDATEEIGAFMATEASARTAPIVAQAPVLPIAFWFFLGAVSVLVLLLMWEFARMKKKKTSS